MRKVFMRKTEEELRLHISRLEAIIDNLPFEVWFKDLKGNYLIINKEVEKYFDKPRKELLGRNDYELYPEDKADFMVGSDQAVMEQEDSGYYELSIDNDVFEDYKRPIFDESGELIGTIGYAKNITQSKKENEALAESERNKTILLANAPGVAFRCSNDAEYTITFISDSCLELTGYTAEELIAGRPAYNQLIPPQYRSALIRKWGTENKQKEFISTDEYPIIAKSGETKWVMEQSQRIFDADHNEVGSEGFIVDVTQRKLAEKALKRSEERFRTIFEEAPLGMAIIDSVTGNICQANNRYAEILGRTKNEVFSSSIKDYSYPEEIEEMQRKMNQIHSNQIFSFSIDKRLIRSDGTDLWISITIAPFHPEDEYSNLQLLCMIQDITERRHAEEEIRYLSYYDQLTGLYNRRFYTEELRRLDTVRNLPITLVMADVNGLKLTNDAFGHLAGDRLLSHISAIIKRHSRSDDIAARIGGDEFLLLLPRTDSEQAEKLVDRIKDAIEAEKDYPVVCSVSFGWDTKKEPDDDIGKIYINAEDRMYRRKLTESPAMRRDTLKLIVRTLLSRYNREKLHVKRVSELCGETAKALGMNNKEIIEMRLAAFLQNIGYIGLREGILEKEGDLTETERTELERHPEIGYQLLRAVGKYSAIAQYVLYHHERIDGKGYPSKAPAEMIPIQSRIIAIADAYDAMTNKSAYHKTLSTEDAVKELRKNAGTQFDPEIVEVFIKKVIG